MSVVRELEISSTEDSRYPTRVGMQRVMPSVVPLVMP
jgi:hypothetical protein